MTHINYLNLFFMSEVAPKALLMQESHWGKNKLRNPTRQTIHNIYNKNLGNQSFVDVELLLRKKCIYTAFLANTSTQKCIEIKKGNGIFY